MSDEIKTENKQTKAATTAKAEKPKPPKKEYSDEELQAIINKAVLNALAQQPQQPTVIMRTEEEMVTLLYMGAVADGSMVSLGDKIGEIQGRGGMLDVPKKVFLQNRTAPVIKRLRDRRLIVINGLTDEERRMYGLVYKDGELLDRSIYVGLLDMPKQRILAIFERACYKHKQLIASLIMESYSNHDNRITQDLIVDLNAISKKDDKDGMFTAILKDMAKSLAEG